MTDQLEIIIDDIGDELSPGEENDPKAVLKAARTKARITFRKLGGAVGLKPSEVCDIEKGRKIVHEDVIIAMVLICACRIMAEQKLEE